MLSVHPSILHRLLLLLLLTLVLTLHSQGTLGAPVESPSTITAEENLNCGGILTNQIEMCLIPFEQKLVVYNAPDTTDYEKVRMRASFCYEYEKTLQCLHTVLLQCQPPSLEHLNIIERRVGYLRKFMDDLCRVPLEAMTPRPRTSRPSTVPTRPSEARDSGSKPTSTTWNIPSQSSGTPRLYVLKQTTTQDLPNDVQSTTTASTDTSTTVPPTTPSTQTQPSTTFNKRLLDDKLNELKLNGLVTTPTPKVSRTESKMNESDKNRIPMDNIVPPNFESSAIEDNIIRINSVNCEGNPRCTMSLTQSLSSRTVASFSGLLSLVTLLLLLQ